MGRQPLLPGWGVDSAAPLPPHVLCSNRVPVGWQWLTHKPWHVFFCPTAMPFQQAMVQDMHGHRSVQKRSAQAGAPDYLA